MIIIPTAQGPITAAQAARISGISKRTLTAACLRGGLKAEKLQGATGAYVIDLDDFKHYMLTKYGVTINLPAEMQSA